MTNHLRPEQRVDRNGRIVTRHVRSDNVGSSLKGNLPAPKVGAAKPKPKKLKQAQLDQTYHDYYVMREDVDEALMPFYATHRGFSFTANDVEAFDVFGAVKGQGNALVMLSRGVRSSEEAESFLLDHKASHLITGPEQREVAQRSLENNVPISTFVSYHEDWSEKAVGPDQLADALAFYCTSLGTVRFSSITRDMILKDEISFADIKAIGITRVKPYDRLHALENLLTQLHKGDADFDTDDIKTLIDRSSNMSSAQQSDFSYICRAVDRMGMKKVLEIQNLNHLATSYHGYFLAPGSDKYEGTAIERTSYLSYILDQQEQMGVRNMLSRGRCDEFFDAGIPKEIALEVIAAGGTLNEARAIHEDNVPRSVAGGWL